MDSRSNRPRGEASVRLKYGSTKRTQDILLREVTYDLGSLGNWNLKRKAKIDEYDVRRSTAPGRSSTMSRGDAFFMGLDRAPKSQQSMMDLFELNMLQSMFKEELQRVLYLGPFRQPPLRRYPTRGAVPGEVGSMGEAAVTMLANETIQRNDRSHLRQVSSWMEKLGLGRKLDVSRVGNSDLFDAKLTLQDGACLALADLGYGISQVLPLLVQCSFAVKNSTLLFEQPELHLHTCSARQMIHVFADTIRHKGCKIVLETHSPDLVNQIQCELREGRLSTSDVAVYKIDRQNKQTNISRIEIDQEGDIYEIWKEGIC